MDRMQAIYFCERYGSSANNARIALTCSVERGQSGLGSSSRLCSSSSKGGSTFGWIWAQWHLLHKANRSRERFRNLEGSLIRENRWLRGFQATKEMLNAHQILYNSDVNIRPEVSRSPNDVRSWSHLYPEYWRFTKQGRIYGRQTNELFALEMSLLPLNYSSVQWKCIISFCHQLFPWHKNCWLCSAVCRRYWNQERRKLYCESCIFVSWRGLTWKIHVKLWQYLHWN
jgi:hypothetical protein